ncbi:MAG: magnesium transporter [Acidimicrobiales bacterium]|jgi:mgtE-like transporter|nr:magnesium transporter [Acidimicrobiales bacterium]|tara:strand:+ start:2452 stop:3666 length:1215 start_codon:yes stop_codon:yes gene_type:complete
MRSVRRAPVAATSADTRQRFVALLIGVLAASAGGLVLAAADGTLRDLPGLLLLVPGAIALRGNVFGAMGSRLGTAVHAGTFRLGLHSEGVVIQNLTAAAALTLVLSVVLAIMAKGTAIVFGISPTMTLADFVVVSVLGGLLASVGVGLATMGLAAGSVRFGWDLDNVMAPLVSTLGDLATVPALVLAAAVAGRSGVTGLVGAVSVVVASLSLVAAWRSRREQVRTIVRQSVPVLGAAALLDLIAGVTVERRLDDLLAAEAVLILLPAFLGAAGALGGILSSRLSTQFHLGLDDATPLPSRASLRDMRSLVTLAVPVFLLAAVAAHLAAEATGQTTPGLGDLVVLTLMAGLAATIFVIVVAYYTTMAAVRFGLDPDTYGIPVVTSTLDLAGAFTLILAMVAVGVA